MAYKNTAITVTYLAWDTSANAGKTGDSANHTLRGVGDGTEYTPSSPSITEVDSTNCPGLYKASLAAGENNYTNVTLHGKSSTANIAIIPTRWQNETSADAVKLGGTTQTGRDVGASVLISSGSGTGQLDVTSGVVKANLVQILASALTETVGGYLTAGFKKLFDVASPVLTAASVNQTGDSYARLGAPAGASVSADVAAVKSDSGAIKTKTDQLNFTGTDVKATLDGETVTLAAATHTGAVIPTVTAVTNGVTVSTNNDKTGYGLSAAAIQGIWDALTSALTTMGTIGKLLVDKIDATISSRSTYAGADTSGTTTLLSRIPGTVQPQTGDAYARLGSPAGASVSADIAGVPDALLKRDMSAVTGEAARSPINALRFLRNKWTVSGGTLTVTKEDDTTTAWSGPVTTDAAAQPITGVDPT